MKNYKGKMTIPFLLPVTTITLLVLCLYLLPLALGTKSAPNTYITDTDGEPMLNGGTYYILPQTTSGGGLTVVPPNTTSPCSLYITQESEPTSKGLPIKTSSTISSKYLPFGPTVLAFPSDALTPTCTQPLVWLPTPDNATGQHYVVAGANHQPAAVPSAFSVLVSFTSIRPWDYRISYCYELVCGSVGIFEENGLLGMNTGASFIVRFKKAFTRTPMLDLPL